MRDFSGIKRLLLGHKKELLERINAVEKTSRRGGEALDDDFAEQAVQRQNDQVLDALDDTGIAELTLINSALERMSDGSYGQCVSCDIEIPLERLKVVPHAEKCIDCAELDDLR